MLKKSMLALTIIAAGAAQAGELSYTYLQAGYHQTEVDADGESVDADGFSLSGSYGFADRYFVMAEAGKADGNETVFGSKVDVEADSRLLGFGFHMPLTEKMDFVASVARAEADVSIDVDGFGEFDGDTDATLVAAGVRAMATDSIEWFANATYVDGDEDSDTQFNLGGLYHVTEQVGFGLAFTSADDADSSTLFARVSF